MLDSLSQRQLALGGLVTFAVLLLAVFIGPSILVPEVSEADYNLQSQELFTEDAETVAFDSDTTVNVVDELWKFQG